PKSLFLMLVCAVHWRCAILAVDRSVRNCPGPALSLFCPTAAILAEATCVSLELSFWEPFPTSQEGQMRCGRRVLCSLPPKELFSPLCRSHQNKRPTRGSMLPDLGNTQFS